MANRIYGRIGDVDPVTHGGGVIFKGPKSSDGFALIYTHGDESEDEDSEGELQVFRIFLPSDYEDLVNRIDWINYADVSSLIGSSLRDRVEATRGLTGPKAAQEYARIFEDIAAHYGWHDFDSDPVTVSRKEANKIFAGRK